MSCSICLLSGFWLVFWTFHFYYWLVSIASHAVGFYPRHGLYRFRRCWRQRRRRRAWWAWVWRSWWRAWLWLWASSCGYDDAFWPSSWSAYAFCSSSNGWPYVWCTVVWQYIYDKFFFGFGFGVLFTVQFFSLNLNNPFCFHSVIFTCRLVVLSKDGPSRWRQR